VINTSAGGDAIGGGMAVGFILPTNPGEYIIRNNEISYNSVSAKGGIAKAGAIFVDHINVTKSYYHDTVPAPLIYNNLIHHNEAGTFGAGIVTTVSLMVQPPNFFLEPQPLITNNTIVDNKSPSGVAIYNGYGVPILMNNILWNDLDSYPNSVEIVKLPLDWEFFYVKYNCIQEGWGSPEEHNISDNPGFKEGTYEISDCSPCIGAGTESLVEENTTFRAPEFDYYKNVRPHPIDNLVDIGAIESPVSAPDLTRPDLSVDVDTVRSGNTIKPRSSKDGMIYVVEVNTPVTVKDILGSALDSAVAAANTTVDLSTSELVTWKNYWLFAIDNCANISDSVVVRILPPVSVNDLDGNQIRIYPTPAENILYIECDRPVSSIELFDITGSKVSNYRSVENRLNLNQLNSGIYFLRITTERNEVHYCKMIKK
jgi:hypothetical protein